MREVSLAVLDIAQNSIDAGATLIEIRVALRERGVLFEITDNGEGMSEETLRSARDRGVSHKGGSGLGLYLLERETAECGGNLRIFSETGEGTRVVADFNGERKIGDLGSTFVALVAEEYDVTLEIDILGSKSLYDTRELKASAGVAELQSSGALRLIREDINNKLKLNGGAML